MAYSKIIIEKVGNSDAEERVGRISAELMKAGILFDVVDETNIYTIVLKGF
jgi:hypothetical protein